MTQEIQLSESVATNSVKLGKKFNARIIESNRWGSTAYYPQEVLERDGTRVFHAGLPIYKNHPTQSDEYERPERNVDDMIGKLVTDATMGQDGLYADIEFYDSFLTSINEKKEDVGLSVRATGLTEDGEMDGRYGPILRGILAAQSVDVVTQAGAGGKIMELLESANGIAGTPITKETNSMSEVTKEDFDTFAASVTEAITSLTSSLTEALAATKPAELTDEQKTALAEADKKTEVTVDDGAILAAIHEAALPAVVIPAVRSAVAGGATVEDAIKAQTDLREALRQASPEIGVVQINEANKATGLARAVELLG